MTKLEDKVFAHSKWQAFSQDAPKDERQRVLDEITPDILTQMKPLDICAHVHEIYGATVDEYAANPHTKDIVDELLVFMDMLPDEAKVLDAGCGPGRDALFMSIPDRKFRKGLMGRISEGKSMRERFDVPTKIFRVDAIDSSLEMVEKAHAWLKELRQSGEAYPGIFPYPVFTFEDMHVIDPNHYGDYDGIWSCTALFTHTPKQLLLTAMQAVARALKQDGLFVTTYTNGRAEGGVYDKLLASSTGRIKYFSQPDPDEIAKIAGDCGLSLESETFSHFEIDGKIIKENLFVAQFFRKA